MTTENSGNPAAPYKTLRFRLKYGFKIAKQKWYKNRIYGKYKPLFDKYKDERTVRVAPADPFPVWCCWWQGEQSMPELVRICYMSICRNAGIHPVLLITKENYRQYVKFPDHIENKAAAGNISLTHLSDILRFELLGKYGGLWTDVTILFTKSLPENYDQNFYSPHCVKDGCPVTRYRWACSLMYMEKDNLLSKFMSEFYREYWKNEDTIIHYLLLDYGIALAYEHIPAVREMIDAVPYNNLGFDSLRRLMKNNEGYDEKVFSRLNSQTGFFKLTRKKDMLKTNEKEELTYYGYIAGQYPL